MTRTMIITAAAAAVTDWCAGERSSSLRNITSPLSSAFLLMILSDMIRYYQISSDINWYHLTLSNMIRYYLILSDIIWHYLIWSDIIWYHQISSDIFWYHLIFSDIISFCNISSPLISAFLNFPLIYRSQLSSNAAHKSLPFQMLCELGSFSEV